MCNCVLIILPNNLVNNNNIDCEVCVNNCRRCHRFRHRRVDKNLDNIVDIVVVDLSHQGVVLLLTTDHIKA